MSEDTFLEYPEIKSKTDRYFIRTVKHIHRVQRNMLYIATNCQLIHLNTGMGVFIIDVENARQLMFNVMKHDQSKFSATQCAAYVELTEYYHQKKALGNKDYQYPEGVEEFVDVAVQNHYEVENHHPERLKGKALKMTYFELIEVICDLQAMAQEFNEGSCRGYFEDVWVKKQSVNFYDDYDWETTKVFMREVISLFERGY